MSVTKDQFKAVMGSFAAGVTVVTTVEADGTPHAMTATAFSSLSANPPLCLVCVDKTARMHVPLTESGKFAVNLLAAGQDAASNHFASKADDKFDGRDFQPGERTGCPILPGVLGWMECEVTEVHRGGDHDIFVGLLLNASAEPDGEPLVYWRGGYRSLTES